MDDKERIKKFLKIVDMEDDSSAIIWEKRFKKIRRRRSFFLKWFWGINVFLKIKWFKFKWFLSVKILNLIFSLAE